MEKGLKINLKNNFNKTNFGKTCLKKLVDFYFNKQEHLFQKNQVYLPL